MTTAPTLACPTARAAATLLAVLGSIFVATAPCSADARAARGSTARAQDGANQRDPTGKGAGGSGASGSGPSNAANYGGGTPLQVNERTGSVSIEAQLVTLGGIVPGISASVALTYELENAINNSLANSKSFGLPYGWSFNFSYVSNNGLYTSFNVDASQSYNVDSNWQTLFTPTGSDEAEPIHTGFLQYNQAAANLRPDDGSVTVGGIASAQILSNLDGETRYMSANGLCLLERDRFGNEIQYFYQRDTDPQNAQIQKIVDSWGHDIVFSYCGEGGTAGAGCEPGQVTITLPDGRTVGYVVVDDYRISKIIDAEGKVTLLSWSDSPCAVGQSVLTGVTSPSGGFTTVQYTCMNVCTAASQTNCLTDGNVTTWPVAQTLYHCPTNGSGNVCPDGSADDFLTTTYAFGTAENPNNYTGFPLYSPYAPADPYADALMSSNNTAFTYATLAIGHESSGLAIYEVENDYDYLHLLTDSTTSVRAQNDDGSYGMQVAKVKAYCYDLPGSDTTGCPLQANYQNLPANYQLESTIGSCVYEVGPNASGQARHQVVTRQYDSFGKALTVKTYHGTAQTGVVSNCDRAALLDPSGLKLVLDDYLEYDTPATVENGYLNLGYGSGHFGLMTAHLSFSYLDQDESGIAALAALSAEAAPVLVTLTCRSLTSESDAVPAGAAVKDDTMGLLPTSTQPPATPGIVSACTSPGWDQSVAPPKVTTLGYDANGRVLSRVTAWAPGFAAQPGVTSTQETYAYTLTATNAGEQACTGGQAVLQTVMTDGQGNQTTDRACTLNGFPLSTIDALGRVVTFEHDDVGLPTTITQPNGTSITYDYYYQCPIAQDGMTATCPATSSASQNCPYDDASPPRTCIVHTLHQGSEPSYADGVAQATMKDGFGRNVAVRDNLGGASGAGYSAPQTRETSVYDSLGLVSSETTQIGASNPLIYQTTVSYGPKLRPATVCMPRAIAHQFVRDDVAQHVTRLENGQQYQQVSFNDSNKLTAVLDCPVVAAGATTSSGDCPTVASDTSTSICSGNTYDSYVLRDGEGLEHSTTAAQSDGTEPGASVSSVSGIPRYSADRLKYVYNVTSVNTGGAAGVSGQTVWQRDLQGFGLSRSLTLAAANGTSQFASDTMSYNNIGEGISETNQLRASTTGSPLQRTYQYTPTQQLGGMQSYAGVPFNYGYDDMDRLIRYCYPAAAGGSEGETIAHDPITGKPTQISHFTNPAACGDCSDNDCGDAVTESIALAYTRFDAVQQKTYSDGTRLQWAYDAYQRQSCFADAVATAHGYDCPDSPTDTGWTPAASSGLEFDTYWADDDTYRRGLPKSTCRGVYDGAAGAYVTKCIDTDYYTSVDQGGSCDASLSSVAGAYAGLVKTRTYCSGGSCLEGTGTQVYQTTYLYDSHRRPCSVQSRDAAGNLILGTTYSFDQYDNVVSEQHASELDPSTASNYQIAYAYDGLMRLVDYTRNDAAGNPLESISYEYDAASNITKKVQSVVLQTTATPTTTPAETPTRAPVPTPTEVPGPGPVATPSPTRSSSSSSSGCQIVPTR